MAPWETHFDRRKVVSHTNRIQANLGLWQKAPPSFFGLSNKILYFKYYKYVI